MSPPTERPLVSYTRGEANPIHTHTGAGFPPHLHTRAQSRDRRPEGHRPVAYEAVHGDDTGPSKLEIPTILIDCPRCREPNARPPPHEAFTPRNDGSAAGPHGSGPHRPSPHQNQPEHVLHTNAASSGVRLRKHHHASAEAPTQVNQRRGIDSEEPSPRAKPATPAAPTDGTNPTASAFDTNTPPRRTRHQSGRAGIAV